MAVLPFIRRGEEKLDRALTHLQEVTQEDWFWGRVSTSGTEEDYYWRRLSDNWSQKDVLPAITVWSPSGISRFRLWEAARVLRGLDVWGCGRKCSKPLGCG
jgi:hypothetical protein